MKDQIYKLVLDNQNAYKEKVISEIKKLILEKEKMFLEDPETYETPYQSGIIRGYEYIINILKKGEFL